jgi:hypothetical protein
MPELGEVKKAEEIGKKKSFIYYKWLACEVCGKERWVRLSRGQPRRANHCQGCGVKLRIPQYTHGDNPQINDIAKGWQINRNNSMNYKYASCPDCGKPSWKVFLKGKVCYPKCTHCANIARRIARKQITTPPNDGDIRNGAEIGKNTTTTYIWRVCSDCKKGKWIRHSIKRQLSTKCNSCAAAKGVDSVHWKGGETISDRGYRIVRIHKDDFYYPMAIKNTHVEYGRIQEHRLVMAKYLGRLLNKDEVIHHINGIKTDNRIENLELTTQINHIKDHFNSYNKGYQDGQNAKSQELQKYIESLENRLNELGATPIEEQVILVV